MTVQEVATVVSNSLMRYLRHQAAINGERNDIAKTGRHDRRIKRRIAGRRRFRLAESAAQCLVQFVLGGRLSYVPRN
jgi:hypothetical protein